MKIIVVLSNEFDDFYEINLDTKLRADHVSSIYKIDDRIITLGWNGGLNTQSISHKVKDYIIDHVGVSDESIISIPDSRDTVGDSFFSRQYIEKNELNNNDVHVITSNWHLKRVKYIFQTCLPNTKIIFHGVETPNGDLEKEGESLQKFKKTFDGVDFSNLESFRKRLLNNHPMYKKNNDDY
mgnify:CR=1 FL=1|tara:strand:+ start:671 stop:1216 length:546 start_codon:yes stop_codon:yes gene_type:complete